MYENLTNKTIIVECGKELNRDGKWDAMAINQALLALAIDELILDDTDEPTITSQVTLVGWNRKVESIKQLIHNILTKHIMK